MAADKVHDRGLELRPRLNVSLVCEAQTSRLHMWLVPI